MLISERLFRLHLPRIVNLSQRPVSMAHKFHSSVDGSRQVLPTHRRNAKEWVCQLHKFLKLLPRGPGDDSFGAVASRDSRFRRAAGAPRGLGNRHVWMQGLFNERNAPTHWPCSYHVFSQLKNEYADSARQTLSKHLGTSSCTFSWTAPSFAKAIEQCFSEHYACTIFV